MTATTQRFSSSNEAMQAVESLHEWVRAFDKEYHKKGGAGSDDTNQALRDIDVHVAVLKDSVVHCSSSPETWEQGSDTLWHNYTGLQKRFEEYKSKHSSTDGDAHVGFKKANP